MRIRTIDRKLLRDAWRLRGQLISIALVVACGVMTVVAMRSTYESLELSRAAYYERARFADVFATLNRAPETLAPRLAAIPGVAAVETRIVLDVALDVPGLDEPATGRLVSVPDGRESALNVLYLREGRAPLPGRGDEAVASEAFAEANGLRLGDAVSAVIHGRHQRLRIVGIGLSPEYVYEVGAGQIVPDSRRFGVLWMNRSALAPAYDMEGAFNDVVLRLAPGASEPGVIAAVDRLLEPYGGRGAYGRADQVSAQIVREELEQNRTSGTAIPVIFLGVAAFLLHIVLSRLVQTQRDQIAVLKAFGYSNLDVGLHFLRFALLAVSIGSIIGAVFGAWIGRALLDVYGMYFRFPELTYRVSWALFAIAVAVSAAAAGLGALSAVRRAVSLPPAEAMRPESPARFRPGLLERIGAGRLLSPAARMILRNVERYPVRAGLSALGVGFSVSILVVGSFMFDAVDLMLEMQFRQVQREDVAVLFNGPRNASARHDMARLDGVLRVEPYRVSPARIHAGHRSRHVPLTGLPEDGELRRILDMDFVRHRPPTDGLLLGEPLADVLGVRAGDTVRVEILEGARPTRELHVVGTVSEIIGMNAYMELGALNRLLREGPTVSGVYLTVDPLHRTEIYDRLKTMPAVASASARLVALENFERQIAESLLISMAVLIGFAAVIAVGVIYNGARIALAERGRELASLRVLGFTRREVAVLLFGEQAVVTAVGIPVGFAIGYFFAAALLGAFETEMYRIPLVVSGSTYAFAGIVGTAAAVLAGLLVRRRLNRLDLIAVLKTRE